MKEKKKISLGEFILVTLVIALVEFFEFGANLALPVPIFGQVAVIMTSFLSILLTISLTFYLILKGVRGTWILAEGVIGIIDTLPIIAILPLKMVIWIVVYFVVNNPKLEKVAGIATGKITSVIKK